MDMVLTNIGADLASIGFISGEFPKIAKVKLGDGSGYNIVHTASDTNLVNVVYETEAVAGLREERVVNVVAVVPVQIGGFTVREIGLFTEDDKMIAVTSECNFPKPNMDNDPTQQTIYMRISISDTQCIDIDFNSDIIYASQQALNEANEHIQILYDELRKKKLLALNSSSVKLSGDIELLGLDNKLFSGTVFYIGDGVSTGQSINIGIDAKNFNVKNNGSGYYLDYNSTTNILLVRDDNDNIVSEGDISFPSIKAEIYRYDAAVDRFRYSSVIGMERSQSITVDTAAVETVSNHILGMSDKKLVVSKVSNTLNGKYCCNVKYMDRIRWYTAPDGGVWIQAYNLATDYFITYCRVLILANRFEIRNPLNKPVDFVYFKGINYSNSNTIGSSAMGENVHYYPTSGTVTVNTTSMVWNFSDKDYFLKFNPNPTGISYFECFANSKYMYTGTFTMASATDNVLDIKDVDGNDRLITSMRFKSLGNNTNALYYQNVKEPKATMPIHNSTGATTVNTVPDFTLEKGKYKLLSTSKIFFNQLYHYVVEFDSELSSKIDSLGVI